jgi:hypothetical protein
MESIDWLDEFLIEGQREWIGMVPLERRLTWRAIAQMAREMHIQAHGHFDDEPAKTDAGRARRAILYLCEVIQDLRAILLIRDQDDQPERWDGLKQARKHDKSGVQIIIGFAVVERECWVLSGFEPEDEGEQKLLASERQNLGFDPRHQSHQLTACKDDTAKRSPKRVLRVLTKDERDRERRCWTHSSLARLRERGKENGLTAYLDEIRDQLVPLILRGE